MLHSALTTLPSHYSRGASSSLGAHLHFPFSPTHSLTPFQAQFTPTKMLASLRVLSPALQRRTVSSKALIALKNHPKSSTAHRSLAEIHRTAAKIASRSLHRSCLAQSAESGSSSATKSRLSFLAWKDATIQRLKEKKAQVLVEYGSTFIFLHETLGIASYGMAFAMAHFGLVNIDDIVNMISIIPDNIKELMTAQKDGIATTAVTALILLKSMDVLGLTPLRWAIAITLTPRIAWWVGPKVDYVVDSVKSRLPQSLLSKRPEINNADKTSSSDNPKPADSTQETKTL